MLLVTGATGTVGPHVRRELREVDADVRVGLRRPDAAPSDLAPTAETVRFDFQKPETWADALAGVDGIFLLRPPGVDADTVESFVAAAGRTGTGRVVYLSGIGSGWNPMNSHYWSERKLEALDVEYTFLRASYFAQNLERYHREEIADRGELVAPVGDGAVSFVDARDIGAVAATALTEPGHDNRAYTITGPAALDFDAVAAVLGDVLDRPVEYVSPSLPRFALQKYREGDAPVLLSMIYTAARIGLAEAVTDDVRSVLGREPRDMRAYVSANAAAFRAD
ncbi:MAG: NAD(P)H-binding protein [Halanaeroarchaeum sp.]